MLQGTLFYGTVELSDADLSLVAIFLAIDDNATTVTLYFEQQYHHWYVVARW